jgi:hypothetical protein
MGRPLGSDDPRAYRQMVLVRRRAFVSAYLTNGGMAVDALVQAGYPVQDKRMMKDRATKLMLNPLVQKMLRGSLGSRNGVEQDRIHEEIKILVKEAKDRYVAAKERQMDADPDLAVKWEEQTNRRFSLLLQATELMLESCTKTLKMRMKIGERQGDEKTLSLVQNVVIVDRQTEEAKKTHEGIHDALDLTPSRVIDARTSA